MWWLDTHDAKNKPPFASMRFAQAVVNDELF